MKRFEYKCSRCNKGFSPRHELEEGGVPVCDECFEIIKNSKTAGAYFKNIKPIKK